VSLVVLVALDQFSLRLSEKVDGRLSNVRQTQRPVNALKLLLLQQAQSWNFYEAVDILGRNLVGMRPHGCQIGYWDMWNNQGWSPK